MSGKRLSFAELVEQARHDSAPPLDVTERVTVALDQAVVVPVGDWTTWLAAGTSVAVAASMLVALQWMGISWNDPFGEWFSSMTVVMT